MLIAIGSISVWNAPHLLILLPPPEKRTTWMKMAGSGVLLGLAFSLAASPPRFRPGLSSANQSAAPPTCQRSAPRRKISSAHQTGWIQLPVTCQHIVTVSGFQRGLFSIKTCKCRALSLHLYTVVEKRFQTPTDLMSTIIIDYLWENNVFQKVWLH